MDVLYILVTLEWGHLFSLPLVCTLRCLQENRIFLSLRILYSVLLLSVLCNGSMSRLCDQSHGFLLSFLNSSYLHFTEELSLPDKPECQEVGLVKQCGYIAGTCHRRKTNVTHSLKLFGNRPLGFYIFFLG